MSNEQYNATPINHGVLSATGNVVAGTAGGALKSGFMTAAIWIGAMTLGGMVLFSALATGGASAGIIPALGALLSSPLTWGALVGAAVGIGSSWLPGGIGAIIGGVRGGSKASDRVQDERRAAAEMQMEIEAMRAQSMAKVASYQPAVANDNKYNFPAQGSPMNLAAAQIDGSTVNRSGTIDAQRQLQQG